MNNDLKKYIKKTLLFTIPFIGFVFLYIYLDPFLVIGHYNNYYEARKGHLSLNHGLVGTRNLDNHYDQYRWNSFLFGNSRARYWRIEDWEKALGPGNIGYHYDAHSETLFGITKKIQYLDTKGVDIKNALLVIDKSVLRETKSSDVHVFIVPPELVNNSNLLKFHYVNFSAFADYNFLKTYWEKEDSISTEQLVTGEYFDYDYSKNEITQNRIESLIEQGEYYTQDLYQRIFEGKQYPNYPSRVYIESKQLELLNEISRIFKKHNTQCKIVISPLYEQSKINAQDIETLKSIFGEGNVFDYSGANDYTNDYHNYYEGSHYRPLITKQLIKEIYQQDSLLSAE